MVFIPDFDLHILIEAILSAMDEYRLAFEKEQHQPSDRGGLVRPEATWPGGQLDRAVGEDWMRGYDFSILKSRATHYMVHGVLHDIYAASKMVPRAVTHNPKLAKQPHGHGRRSGMASNYPMWAPRPVNGSPA